MQAIPDALVPVLTSTYQHTWPDGSDPYTPVLDEFVAGLAVCYAVASRLDAAPLCWADLADPYGPLAHLPATATDEPADVLRRFAVDNLTELAVTASLHGPRPALMVSCHGVEASLLLVDEFWTEVPGRAARLGVDLPGDLVVGVPARDVLVVTGADSVDGLAKARRCVERVFLATDHQHADRLLTRALLVRRDGRWEVFGAAAPPERGRERWSPPEDRILRPRRAAVDPFSSLGESDRAS